MLDKEIKPSVIITELEVNDRSYVSPAMWGAPNIEMSAAIRAGTFDGVYTESSFGILVLTKMVQTHTREGMKITYITNRDQVLLIIPD